MAKTFNEVATGKIEVVDIPEEKSNQKGFKLWWLVPVVLLLGTGTLFFVWRRFQGSEN